MIVGRDGKSDVPPAIVFVVPKGGYAEPPITWVQEDNGFCSNDGKGQIVYIVVDENSPVFSGRSTSMMLADWTPANGKVWIAKDNIDFSLQKKSGRVAYRYTYGSDSSSVDDGNAPTGLWVDIRSNPLVIIVR